MTSNSDWKLKLRYGKEVTPFTHFTVLGAGNVFNNDHGFECPLGPAVMAIKVWATDANEAADMLHVIGQQVGFDSEGEVEIYETEPEEPPKKNQLRISILSGGKMCHTSTISS